MKIRIKDGKLFRQHHGEDRWFFMSAAEAERLAASFEADETPWFRAEALQNAAALRKALQQLQMQDAA